MIGGIRTLWVIASVAMAGAVIAGLWVLGTPSHQRDLRLDARRIDSLVRIATSLHYEWTQHHALPAELTALDIPADFKTDPMTAKPYTYKRLNDGTYSLCADFAAASDVTESSPNTFGAYQTTSPAWKHSAGPYCFSFVADSVAIPIQ